MIMTIRMIGHHLMDSLISCSLIKLSSHHFFSFLDPWSQIGLLKVDFNINGRTFLVQRFHFQVLKQVW